MPGVAKTGNVYESQDPRDTDPKQPGGRRRVKVTRIDTEQDLAQVENLSTGRKTVVMISALMSSKWKLI